MRKLCRMHLAGLLIVLFLAVPSGAIIRGDPSPAGGRSTVVLTMPNGTICSGTIVGPRIVLTTAHCVGGDRVTPVFAKVGERVQEMTCALDPRFPGETGGDLALCASKVPFANHPIARVGVDPHLVERGGTVTLFGYGCRLAGGIDRGIGQLTSGKALVVGVSGAEAALSGAVLCAGDGGGGAYVSLNPGGDEVLIGVNSRGDLEDRSWIALMTAPAFVTWAHRWSEPLGGICGMSDASACAAPAAEVSVEEPTDPSSDPSGRALTAERLLSFTPPSIGPKVNGVPVRQLTRITLLKGETLEDGVNRACGPVPDEYYSALSGLQHEGQTQLIRALPATIDMEIDILPCPRSLTGPLTKVEVERGDTLWDYYETVGKESAGWRGLEAPVGTARAARKLYFVDAIRALNPGVKPNQLSEGMSLQLPKLPVASRASTEATTAGAADVTAILALQGADGACTAPDSYTAYPFDADALLDVLARNLAERSSRRWDLKRILVLTADTGIFGARQGIFRNDGILVQNEDEDLRPLGKGPEPMHGTEVASLILGGPFLARIQTIAPRRISLVSRRIYVENVTNSGETFYRAEDDVMGSISRLVSEDGVQVVNLSLKTAYEIRDLENQARDANPRALYIAAAGNHDGLLGAPGSAVYPAMFGGAAAPGLLVVAALDGMGALAPFSNYGSQYVEIGAPGCLVPAISAVLDEGAQTTGFNATYVSGTSLAAPLVAFAAALFESEGSGPRVMLPGRVKRRLLASADLRTELTPSIADGRALNIVKAVSAFHDVVELKDSSRLIFGNVTFLVGQQELAESHVLELTCDASTVPLKVSDILKVVPAFAKRGKPPTFKVYARSNNSVLRNLECDTPATLSIRVQDVDQNTTTEYRLDEVADIVRREQ